MEVTEVKIYPTDEDKLRAYVTITLDHCFVISDLKIITGSKGYFLLMPSRKRKMAPIETLHIQLIVKHARC
jgi:stage V sporulation protein G